MKGNKLRIPKAKMGVLPTVKFDMNGHLGKVIESSIMSSFIEEE